MTQFAYAAHTRSAVFFLDVDGVCQDIQPVSGEQLTSEHARCIGAQYVATLDMTTSGGLVPMPKLGCAMLFVVADAHMRFSLVRTAAVVRFDTLGAPAGDTMPAPPPKEVLDTAIQLAGLPQIKVSWPNADVLARGLPLPALSQSLLAAPAHHRTPAAPSGG